MIAAKTEGMFDLFNQHFYHGELIRPAITVSPDGGRGAYGWCSVYEIWQANEEAHREINICAEARSARKRSAGRATGYINRPIAEVAATMRFEGERSEPVVPRTALALRRHGTPGALDAHGAKQKWRTSTT